MAMTAARRPGPLAEINVTPFADVIVVLLIIFMIAVPMLSKDAAVSLPDARHALTKEEGPRTVTVTRDGSIRVGAREVTEPELLTWLQQELSDVADADRMIYVRADDGLPYARVERVLAVARQAGSTQVGIMTLPRPR